MIRLLLCGDVMTGRGIDQILPHPGDPTLHEPCIHDARSYVELAESMNGSIPRPVSFDYIWGDALAEIDRAGAEVRIINLETSITSSSDFWRGKEIHYRMHPRNVGCLTAARLDCCCLANNHVLDWGYDGLAETLRTLDAAGIAHAGAGRNAAEAAAPAILAVPGKGRVLVFSYGSVTSGIPREWAATAVQAGVNLLASLSEETAVRIAEEMGGQATAGDVLVASIHWGANWGWHVREEERRFAHRLVEEGIAVVYGHSSHHVKPIEIYRAGLVLYGCGDFMNDYEGIDGYEEFRADLTLMYLADVEPRPNERLVEAQLVPFRVARGRLNRAADSEVEWLWSLLNELGEPLGTCVDLLPKDEALNLPSRLRPRVA